MSDLPLKTFIGSGKAAIVIRMDAGGEDTSPHLKHRLGEGCFHPTKLKLRDEYANTMDPQHLMDDQFRKLQNWRNNFNTEMLMLGWALTQQWTDVAVEPLTSLAESAMTPRLGPEITQTSSKRVYPNMIGIDGVMATCGVAVAVAINVMVTSEFGKGR